MPQSEASYADRVQKARNLYDAVSGLSPVFVPAPGGVSLPTFDAAIDTCDSLVGTVDSAKANWQDAVGRRSTTAKTIQDTTTQLINYIKSSTTWKNMYAAAKRFADAVRGKKATLPPLPEPPPGETPAKRIQRGGESFAELEKNWRGLVNLAIALPGFSPVDVKIQAGTISGLLSSIRSLNEEVSLKEAALSEAQQARYSAFYATGGLGEMFQTLKVGVKGQYGTTSPQWAQVKGIKW